MLSKRRASAKSNSSTIPFTLTSYQLMFFFILLQCTIDAYLMLECKLVVSLVLKMTLRAFNRF